MLIMLDSNVLISAFLFPSSNMQKMIDRIAEQHQIVLCSHIIDELHRVINRKFPHRIDELEGFLCKLPYELVYTPRNGVKLDIQIRNPDDYPVLASAILADVDILITGDKDFDDVIIDKPEILSPKEFLETY